MPETSMPPPPKNSGSGPFIGAVIVMLLLMGGLLWWKFGTKPEEPKPPLPPTPPTTPRTDEEPPPPPPPPEPDAGKATSAHTSTKKVTSVNTGCSATCSGNAGAPLQGALSGAAGSVRSCYEKALRNDPLLQGKLMVSVKISPTGNVCSAKIATDTLNGPGVSACVLNRFRGSSFPPPSGGCVDVNIPINFTPKK